MNVFQPRVQRRATVHPVDIAAGVSRATFAGRLPFAHEIDSQRRSVNGPADCLAFNSVSQTLVENKWCRKVDTGTIAADTTHYKSGAQGVRRVKTGAGGAQNNVNMTFYADAAFMTLPNWRQVAHLRFYVTDPGVGGTYSTDFNINLQVGIAHTAGWHTAGNVDRMTATFSQQQGRFARAGWYEVSVDLNEATLGANLERDTPAAIKIVTLNVVYADTAVDITFDELWFTPRETLGSGRGCCVIMLDDANTTHATNLAQVADRYGHKMVFPIEVDDIGVNTIGWDDIARLSAAGHEFIIHDMQSMDGLTEQQVGDRMDWLLETWLCGAEKNGVPNYARGARFYLAMANHLQGNVVAAARTRFLDAFGQNGADTGVMLPYNCWPRCFGAVLRIMVGPASFGVGERFRTVAQAAHDGGMVGVLYSHLCYTDTIEPTMATWDTDLAWLATQGIRCVTFSELYDHILPREMGQYNLTATGITASTTQTQGQRPLTANQNIIATCANANDAVTLRSARPGDTQYVRNEGAQVLQVFPATDHKIDGGAANASTTIAADASKAFRAIDAESWYS